MRAWRLPSNFVHDSENANQFLGFQIAETNQSLVYIARLQDKEKENAAFSAECAKAELKGRTD
jgi:hypothetical protein